MPAAPGSVRVVARASLSWRAHIRPTFWLLPKPRQPAQLGPVAWSPVGNGSPHIHEDEHRRRAALLSDQADACPTLYKRSGSAPRAAMSSRRRTWIPVFCGLLRARRNSAIVRIRA